MRRDFKNISFAFISNEILVGLVFFLFTLLIFFLINQQKLLYIISAVLALLIIGWAQFNLKRWIYLCFIFLPFSPSINLFAIKTLVSIELSDIVVWLTIFVFILSYALRIRERRKIDSYLFIPVIIYLAISLFFTILSYYDHLRLLLVINGLGHLFKWSSYIFLYFIMYMYFQNERDIIMLLRIILLVFALGSLVTVYRYISYSGGEFDVYYRVGGLIEGLNSYAVLLAIILIFYYNLFLQGYARKLFPLPIFVGLCSLLLMALILTFSRTGWATLWLFVIFLTFFRKRRILGIGLILFSILNFYIARQPVQERIEMTLNQPTEKGLPIDLGGRYGIWRMTIRKTLKRFYFGVGYLNFSQEIAGTTPHNQFLALIAELSIFGLAAFLFLLYRLFRACLWLYRYSSGWNKEFAFGSLIILSALVFASFTGEYFYGSPIMLIFLSFYLSARLGYQLNKEKNIKFIPAVTRIKTLEYRFQ